MLTKPIKPHALANAVERELFDSCSGCSCTSDDLKQAGNRWPRMMATTEPGELAETRERKPVPAGFALSGMFIAAIAVLACWAGAAGLAALLRSLG